MFVVLRDKISLLTGFFVLPDKSGQKFLSNNAEYEITIIKD